MRKIAFGAALLAAVSMFGTVPVNAANTTSGRTDLSLYVANDPVYTVTVPETVALSATENTQVPITASGRQENLRNTRQRKRYFREIISGRHK